MTGLPGDEHQVLPLDDKSANRRCARAVILDSCAWITGGWERMVRDTSPDH
jgi:hypothetical protein